VYNAVRVEPGPDFVTATTHPLGGGSRIWLRQPGISLQ